jgi:rhodanese-related sulfurtransferase
VVLGVGLAAYAVYRVITYRRYRLLDVAPRVSAEEVAQRLAAAAPGSILIADVRSHGYYDGGSERIAGSIRLEPNRLEEEIKNLSKEHEIYLYCT